MQTVENHDDSVSVEAYDASLKTGSRLKIMMIVLIFFVDRITFVSGQYDTLVKELEKILRYMNVSVLKNSFFKAFPCDFLESVIDPMYLEIQKVALLHQELHILRQLQKNQVSFLSAMYSHLSDAFDKMSKKLSEMLSEMLEKFQKPCQVLKYMILDGIITYQNNQVRRY